MPPQTYAKSLASQNSKQLVVSGYIVDLTQLLIVALCNTKP